VNRSLIGAAPMQLGAGEGGNLRLPAGPGSSGARSPGSGRQRWCLP
jgi:hypothetical protein